MNNTHPSALPHWPGLDEMQAYNLPELNCSSTWGSSLRSSWRFSIFLWTWLLFFASSVAPSPSCNKNHKPWASMVWIYRITVFVVLSSYLCVLLCSSSSFLLPANVDSVVLKVPLLEWSCINLNNGTFDESLCSHKLVIWCVVDHIENTSFASNCFASPWVISSVESKSSPLHVASSHSNSPYSLVAWDLRVSRLTTKLVPTRTWWTIRVADCWFSNPRLIIFRFKLTILIDSMLNMKFDSNWIYFGIMMNVFPRFLWIYKQLKRCAII